MLKCTTRTSDWLRNQPQYNTDASLRNNRRPSAKNIRLCLKLIIAADVTSMTCCESTNLLQWSESEGLMRAQDGEI